MGIRGSDTHSLMFTDVKVPKENRIGDDGFGFNFAMAVLNGGRIGIASQALGIAKGAFELALQYAQDRKAFGKEIFKHQAIAFKLADMATQIAAAEMLVLKAASEKDAGQDISQSGAMAKLFASQTAMDTTIEAVQIHGGYGYTKDQGIEQLFRDNRITPIYEGTNGIQAMDLVGRKIISDGGLGARELISEMKECTKNPAIVELVSVSQLKRFSKSIDDLDSTITIILNHSDNKELVGKIAFDTLMMAGTITASWQMLLSLDRASNAVNNHKSSAEFLKEKADTVKHFIDFILPRYLSSFTTISASAE